MSGDKRTVAFQVPGELFERFKDYLQEKGIKQNAFFLDCIHRAWRRPRRNVRLQGYRQRGARGAGGPPPGGSRCRDRGGNRWM